ncbi:MAG TPA: CBS domain-containing protein [Candidatus Moranbacteria bacterium]|nr:CBS domain-containing protein [Candidatus Moranbacteria bacterium]
MKIKEIMTKEVITADISDKISKIAELMTKNRIHGIPILKNGQLAGIVTETDFFVNSLPDLYLPSYINFLKETKISGDLNKEKKEEIEKLVNSTAGDIMTAECVTLEPDSETDEMIKIIKEKHFFTFPVINKDMSLAGIVTQADIIKLI